MRVATYVVVVFAAVGCFAALAISIYPGELNDLVSFGFLLAILAAPIVVPIVLVVLFVVARKKKFQGVQVPWRPTVILLSLLICTSGLLIFYVPRRIAFATSRGAFEQLLADATETDFQGEFINRRLGMYHVDNCGMDPRGGVFFRTFQGSAGLGPDVTSYGFVYQPNQQGTPFGAADYRVFSLGNDWYWFRASDDWY